MPKTPFKTSLHFLADRWRANTPQPLKKTTTHFSRGALQQNWKKGVSLSFQDCVNGCCKKKIEKVIEKKKT